MARPRKYPAVNPQSAWSKGSDCCNRNSEGENHAPGCMNNPANKHPQAAPDKSGPHKLVQKAVRPGWCTFRSKGQCYLEGAFLEEGGQEISLSPAGSYRQRNNKNLELVSGTIPVMDETAPTRPHKNASVEDRRAFLDYETSFIDSLEDGDPRVGAAVGGLKLIKQ